MQDIQPCLTFYGFLDVTVFQEIDMHQVCRKRSSRQLVDHFIAADIDIIKYHEKQNSRSNYKRILIFPCSGRLKFLSGYQMLQVRPDKEPEYIENK